MENISEMAIWYLDTSALVKRYHVEVGTETVDRLFAHPDDEIVISRLGFVELISALAMKVRGGILTVQALEAARRRFLGDVKSRRILVVRLLVGHFRIAERLVYTHSPRRRLRTLDALQRAVALQLHERQGGVVMVTADSVLLEIGQAEELTTLNPD